MGCPRCWSSEFRPQEIKPAGRNPAGTTKRSAFPPLSAYPLRTRKEHLACLNWPLRSHERGFFLRYRISDRDRRLTIGSWYDRSVTLGEGSRERFLSLEIVSCRRNDVRDEMIDRLPEHLDSRQQASRGHRADTKTAAPRLLIRGAALTR